MVDFVVRVVPGRGFLPIIVADFNYLREELYRGNFFDTAEAALTRALEVWDQRETGNVREFRQQNP